MKIKEYRVRNFRSLKELELRELKNFNVLIGKNSSGKTSVLESINLFFNTISKKLVDFKIPIDLSDNTWYQKDVENPITFKMTLIFEKNEINELNVLIKEIVGIEKVPEEPMELTFIAEIYKENENVFFMLKEIKLKDYLVIGDGKIHPLIKGKKGDFEFNDDLKKVILETISNSLKDRFHFLTVNRYTVSSTDEIERKSVIPNDVIWELSGLHNKTDRKSERLYALFERYLNKIPTLGNKIDYCENKIVVRNALVRVPIELIGGGDQEILRLIYYLTINNGIFAIEEPESHLHANLIRILYTILLDISKTKQIFITTHSPIFVDITDMSSIWLVYKEEDETKLRNIVDDIGLKDVSLELGFKPSDVFLSDKVVFVEGNSDKIFITKIAKILDLFNYNVTLMPVGGKSKAKRHLKLWVEIAKRANVSFFILMDKDAEKEIKNLLKDGLIQPEQYHLWSKDELEDYYPSKHVSKALKKLLESYESPCGVEEANEIITDKKKNTKEKIEFLSSCMKIDEREIKTYLAKNVGEMISKEEIEREMKDVVAQIFRVNSHS